MNTLRKSKGLQPLGFVEFRRLKQEQAREQEEWQRRYDHEQQLEDQIRRGQDEVYERIVRFRKAQTAECRPQCSCHQ